MKHLTDYIMVIDDALSAEFCNSLVESYDQKETKDSTHEWQKDYRSFTEYTLPTNEPESETIWKSSKSVITKYQEHCGIEWFPPKFAFEGARMKKYKANDYDQFGWHVDVGDSPSSNRFLVMFYYLNDVDEGGETIFDYKVAGNNLTIKPKKGRVVVFPPMWMYPHKGNKPVSADKYILSTYASYL